MQISNSTMERVLIKSKLVSPEQLESLKTEAARLKESLQDLAINQKIVDPTSLSRAYADYIQVPFIELSPSELQPEVTSTVPERVARQYNAILFKIDENGTKHLAMEDPDDVQAVNFLQKELGANLKIYVAAGENILTALDYGYGSNVDEQLNEIIEIQRADENEQIQQQVDDPNIGEQSAIAQTVNLILEQAIRSHASDVHIEPRENYIQIRYRVDGILKEENRLPISTLTSLVSRIKIIANMKIDEHRVPQDGRFKLTVSGKNYALRVSTMPIADGEKIVMRILDESQQAVGLDSLGLWGHSLEVVKRTMSETNGVMMITGPTGSGKSTTLFSILTVLNRPDVNIATIEDPVEYRIPGTNQTQVNPKAGMTFADGLRSLLRQDPNIIMVGEIRDSETANLGIQAALTGHMVFTTLHTNNAATALPRLLDMSVEPFLIASTIRSVVGQRLVRRLDRDSRKSIVPSEEQKASIRQLFRIPPGQDFRFVHELEKQAAAAGIGGDTPLSTDENGILNLWIADSNVNKGSVQEGYQGRIGIYEVLENTETIEKMLISKSSSSDIENQAIKDGMISMQLDGLVKALRGETTIEEVLRVSKD